MSDSDDDILQRNCITFQNENTTVWARGPNITTSLNSLSLRNNILTSTMQMPSKFDRPRLMEANFDQRSTYSRRGREISPMSNFDQRSTYYGRDTSPMSNFDRRSAYYRRETSPMSNFEQRNVHYRREISPMSNFGHKSAFYQRDSSPMSNIDRRRGYYRRETSPMSMYGGGDARAYHFNNSYYPRDFMGTTSSQRSVVNGRSGSPMSIRSTASNTSMSARCIAMALKNTKFNKYDQRLIKDAYSKYMKNKVKNKIQKRRNLRLFMKNIREQGSDSSTSSDDVRSTKGSIYNGHMSSCRSTNTDIVDFRRTITESNMYKDCSNNLRRNTFKNVYSILPRSVSNHSNKQPVNMLRNGPPQTQKERFENGFLLPSQRFNQSTSVLPILESDECVQTIKEVKRKEIARSEQLTRNCSQETDSEQDELFSDITVREKSVYSHETERKRSLNSEDNIYLPHKKRHKLSSPVKRSDRTKKSLPKQTNKTINKGNGNGDDIQLPKQTKLNNSIDKENSQANEFEFAKPSLPLRKSKTRTKEKLISKSAPPVVDQCVENRAQGQTSQSMDVDLGKQIDEPSQVNSVSDLSMRPSFIKRKLFTQKLDVAEKQNNCADNFSQNSPQANIYSSIQNEKHKSRKLVTSQSCLSRDVREGNNLLDLIHKIVPPDQMSVTNQMNKTETTHSKNNTEDDKWDVTSIISTCNDDNISETYTDEEIFTDKTKTNDIPKEQHNAASFKSNSTVLCNSNIIGKSADIQTLNKPEKVQTLISEYVPKKKPQNYVKSFWDIESESDVDCTTPKNHSLIKENQRTYNFTNKETKKNQAKNKPEPRNNKTINNNVTAPNTYKALNNTHRILSHRSPKKKKCNEELAKKADSKSTFLDMTHQNTKINKKNQSLSIIPQKISKNMNVSTKNDTSSIVNIATNRKIRSCRLNESLNDTRKKIECNRSLQVILTPIKINKKSKNNLKMTEVKTRKSNISFSLVSAKPIHLANKLVDESPTNCKTRGKSKETKNRKSDVSFSLPSNKKSPETKNSLRNKQKTSISKNNSKSDGSKLNFSMTLRSSKSPAYKRSFAKKELKSKPSTKANKSRM